MGWLWCLALLLSLVDAWLCLVDFDEVCVHAALYDAVINHSSVGFRFTELSHEGSYRSYRSYHSLRSLEVKANSLLGWRFSHKAYGFNFSNFFKFFNFPICVSCVNDSLILCQLPDSATFWVLIDDRRLSSIVTALGRNRCLLRGSLSTFIGWRCKENANERNESLLSNCRVQLFFCKDNTFFGCLFICRMTC